MEFLQYSDSTHVFVSYTYAMFRDRLDAGRQLAEKLLKYEKKNPLVVALPRGGVSVGFPIAQVLRVPLEVIIVRKLGVPQNPEFGIGAIAEDGVTFLDTKWIEALQISPAELRAIKASEKVELERRAHLYRKGKLLPLLTSKTVILVDDGLATGVTARAALMAIKKHHPKKIVLAVPICSKKTMVSLSSFVDTIICLQTPEHLESVGMYYRDFHQITDGEVVRLLKEGKEQKGMRVEDSDFGSKIVW